jgi:Ca2+-binding EF-hand superfamily protein
MGRCLEEFFAWWSGDDRFSKLQAKLTKVEEWSRVFKSYDKDGSGVIEKNEFAPVYADLSKLCNIGKSADDTFKEIDQNGDGKISFNEYVDYLLIHS